MKKYKLKLKNPSKGFKFDGIVKHDGWCDAFKWLVDDSDMPYSYSQSENYAKQCTQEEIDSLPHGVVKLHDIIEVEEKLYYIKMPYARDESNFLNYRLERGDVLYADKGSNSRYQTKFTLEEVEKYYPLFANDTFLVKVEELDE